jgi:hypothetical protein
MRRLTACFVVLVALAVPAVGSAAGDDANPCGQLHGMTFTFGAPPLGGPGALGDFASAGNMSGGLMGGIATSASAACRP